MSTFVPAANSPFPVGSRPDSIATGDFNNDGNTDIVTVNGSSDDLSILLGDGSGNFNPAISLTGIGNPTGVAVGDLNRDGNIDLVVTTFLNFDPNNNFAILLGNGTGNFGEPINLSTVVSVRGFITQDVTIGDFNGDGNPDLAFALDTTNGRTGLLLGDGLGNFATPIFTNGAGINPNTIVAEDFNQDGILDIAVSTDILFSDAGVTVVIGGNPVRFFTGDPATSIAKSLVTGDFNNDTNPDLAVVNTSSNSIGVLLGDGTGSFSTPITIVAPGIPRFLGTGDFDSDGNLDIAATSFSRFSGNFSGTAILRGDGTGNFTVANVVNSEESNSGPIAVADLNNDGKLDFATIDSLISGDNHVTVLLGSSNDSSPINLDIDGDGETDALTDGILAIKYLFGSTGDALTGGSVSAGATRTTADEIINYLDSARSTMLDVDGNGIADALTDGLLILRYLFGLTGNALIRSAVAEGADRTTADEIEAFLSSFDLPVASQLDDLSFGGATAFLGNTAIF